MKKFEIINNSLVVTDTLLNKVIFDNPKSDIYYSLSFLTLTPNKISIIDLSDKYNQTNVFECLLSESVNSSLVPFTVQTFTDFARQSLGFKTASGGSGAITDHTQLTNIGTNTHAQIDTHIGNKQNSLTVDETGAKYPTVDAVNSALSSKQNTLVSGTNIKTINGNSLLGSGDLVVNVNKTLQQVTEQGAFTNVPIEIEAIGAIALSVSSDVGYAISAGCANGTAGLFDSNNTAIFCRANNIAGRFEITTGNTIATFNKGSIEVAILGNGSITSKKLLVNSTDNGIDIIQANGSILGTAFKKSGDTNANILLAGGGVTPLILNQTAVANATNAGRLRYYVSGAFSILECCMQTGATNYQWILISQQEIL